MKYAITEEQFLIYHYGEKKALFILKNNLPDHYRTAYHKLQNGGNFGWNWATFFFGSLWFIYQGMPLAFFAFFISMSIISAIMPWILIMSGLALFYSILGLFGSLTLFGILAGFFGDQFLINRLSEKLKNGYFGDLHPDTQSKFIEKMGVTEEQYLTFIYGQEKAQSLIKHNIPNHYREAFKKFALGQRIIWNWAATNSYLWCIYRRLSLWAVIYLAANIFLMLLNFSVINALISSPSFLGRSSVVIATLIHFIGGISLTFAPFLFANYILFSYVKKQIQNGDFNYLPKGPSKTFLYLEIARIILTYCVLISYCVLVMDIDHSAIPIFVEKLTATIVEKLLETSVFSTFTHMIIPIIAVIYTKQYITQNKKMMKDKS